MCHEWANSMKTKEGFLSDIFQPAPLAIVRVSETGQGSEVKLRGASSPKTIHTRTHTHITQTRGSKLRTRHGVQRRTEKDKEAKRAYEKEGKEGDH